MYDKWWDIRFLNVERKNRFLNLAGILPLAAKPQDLRLQEVRHGRKIIFIKQLNIQEEPTDHLFYSPTIYQPSFLSTLPLNTHLATYHNARTKEKDRWSSIRIDRLDLLVEALGEGGDNVLQSRLEVLAQRPLLINCSQKI